MAEVQIQSVSHRHEAIIDWLLVNPHEKNLQKLCDTMNVSRSWLSIVMNSDVFREKLAKRRLQYNEQLHAEIIAQQYAVAGKALAKVSEALDGEEVSPTFALESARSVCNMLGFSPKPGNRPQVVSEVERTREVTRQVAPDILESARETLRVVSRSVPALEGSSTETT